MKSLPTTFEFSSYHFSLQDREARFHYILHFPDGAPLHFTEKILFPDKPLVNDIPLDTIDNLFHSIHLMLGISYWKLYCPHEIKISTKPLSKNQAEFWNTVYTKGLGEFFYRNKIDFRGLVQFPSLDSHQKGMFNQIPNQVGDDRDMSVLVGIGGGKDSIVSVELLKKNNVPLTGFILETQKDYGLVDQVVETMGIDSIRLKRLIDPLLFDHNALPDVYNGHIPISAVYAFLGVLTGLLFDYQYVVVSNEHSANVGNATWNGVEINHQWSKSAQFEALFRSYIHTYITPQIDYVSLLRPLSEIKIVEIFTHYPTYFPVFSSCNRNFKIHKESGLSQQVKRCRTCPKCAFLFILLAAFLPKEKVLQIFGGNMLADATHISMYKDLLGITGLKPWDCVGTFEGSQVAMWMIAQKKEFASDVVMQMFEKEVLPTLTDMEGKKKELLVRG